jgi:hypothetical protein
MLSRWLFILRFNRSHGCSDYLITLASVGRSWGYYCWNSSPSLYAFRETFVLRGLARCCLSFAFNLFKQTVYRIIL